MAYGCLFHYGNVCGKMQQNHLESIYKSDVNGRKNLTNLLTYHTLRKQKTEVVVFYFTVC